MIDPYMLLSRLQMDCKYYLGYGGRHPKHLFYDNEIEHITNMLQIYNRLEIKPEWLKLKEIKKYGSAMLNVNKTGAINNDD